MTITHRSLPDHGHSPGITMIMSSALDRRAIFTWFSGFLHKKSVPGTLILPSVPEAIVPVYCNLFATKSMACQEARILAKHVLLPHRIYSYGSVHESSLIRAANPGLSVFLRAAIQALYSPSATTLHVYGSTENHSKKSLMRLWTASDAVPVHALWALSATRFFDIQNSDCSQ